MNTKKLFYTTIVFVFSLVHLEAQDFLLKKNHDETINMIYIPEGEFYMGSKYTPDEIQEHYGYEFTESVKDSWEIERPFHKVKIEKGFYISKFEVTVAEFQEFVNDTGYLTDAKKGVGSYSYNDEGEWSEINNINWRKPGLWETEPNQPVVLVSWNDVTEYTKWLRLKTGKAFRLPTEQEWEFACRFGSDTNFTWGDNPIEGKGKINALDSYFQFEDGFKYVAPVGSYEPNANGLYDMLSNVWEWCSSPYVKQYLIELKNPESDEYVDRGGGWDSPPFNARISNRGAAGSKFNTINLGFRIVMEKH
jgi:formylglycine-generating enzyme required for sulfatase activity